MTLSLGSCSIAPPKALWLVSNVRVIGEVKTNWILDWMEASFLPASDDWPFPRRVRRGSLIEVSPPTFWKDNEKVSVSDCYHGWLFVQWDLHVLPEHAWWCRSCCSVPSKEKSMKFKEKRDSSREVSETLETRHVFASRSDYRVRELEQDQRSLRWPHSIETEKFITWEWIGGSDLRGIDGIQREERSRNRQDESSIVHLFPSLCEWVYQELFHQNL